MRAGLACLPEDGDDEESKRPASPEETIIQLEQDDPRAIDFRNCLRNWFRKVPFSSIRLHDIQKWLYWSIFNVDLPPLESLPESHRTTLHWALDLLQKRSGWVFEEGSNPHAQPMRITLDDVHLMWRPLTYYLIVNVINFCIIHWYMNGWNVQRYHYDDIEWVLSSWRLLEPVLTHPYQIPSTYAKELGFCYGSSSHRLRSWPRSRPLPIPQDDCSPI